MINDPAKEAVVKQATPPKPHLFSCHKITLANGRRFQLQADNETLIIEAIGFGAEVSRDGAKVLVR